MKKFLVGLVAVLGLSSVAMAADPLPNYRARFGVTLGFGGGGVGFGIASSIDANRLASFSPTIGLGVRAGLGVTFGNPVGFNITAAPVATFSINPDTAAYVGPALGVSVAGGTSFIFGVTGGAEFAVSAPLNVFADATLYFVPVFFGSFGGGVEYQISPPLGLFGRAGVTFAGGGAGFGLTAGASYRF